MGRLRWFDLAAAVLVLAWTLQSDLANASFGMNNVEGLAWWGTVIGKTLLPLLVLAIYFGLVWWAARRPSSTGRRD